MKINIMKKIVPVFSFIVSFVLILFPWIVIGERSFSLIEFVMKLSQSGLEYFLALAKLPMSEMHNISGGIYTELGLFGLFLILNIVYIITVFLGKRWRLNLIIFGISLSNCFVHVSGSSLQNLSGEDFTLYILHLLLLFISGMEYMLSVIFERWQETVDGYKEFQEKEEARVREEKERLQFDGKYSKYFYRLIWKNFKSSWKDYALLLTCSSVAFGFILIGMGLQNVLAVKHSSKGIGLFSGLGAILVNAIIPLAVVSIAIIVILIFYYLNCRAQNYGIFLTLGMRKNTLYFLMALEFGTVVLMSLLAGGIFGTAMLGLLARKLQNLLGIAVSLSVVGIYTYIKAIASILLVFLISFITAKDILMDFNVGNATDVRAMGEKMPMRWRKPLITVGMCVCVYCVFAYSRLCRHENVYLIVAFVVGLFFIIRFGMAELLIQERKQRSYIKKLLSHNQMYHKSKTHTSYVLGLSVVHLCVLFYFSFQIVSSMLMEDNKVLFPYDMMCIADDGDDTFFAKLQEQYDLEMYTYPMVRVSAYDSTEVVESEEAPPQGQHIGISESTYHALKKQLDPSYEEKSLDLDAEGKLIYIVHQQDNSIKAQPIDYYMSTKKPLLHIGLPCEKVNIRYTARKDVGYSFKRIRSEEISSLTGSFRQGLRENLVVFSDEYFEEAQEMWKYIHIETGEVIENEADRIPNETIYQGPTKLVLINADAKNLEAISERMSEFKERHRYDELQDASVLSYYTKEDAVNTIQAESIMKIAMNLLVMITFFIVHLVLIVIKLFSEKEENKKRAEFLTSMGMYRKKRFALLKNEIMRYYYLLPMGIAMVSAVFFTTGTFLARMYTQAERVNYVKYVLPIWLVYISASGILLWILVEIYARKVEVNRNERHS